MKTENVEELLRRLAAISAETMEIGLELRAAKREAILELRARGKTWAEIGAILGTTAQRAHEIAR